MVRISVYCVKCGKMVIDDVPLKWREEVRKEVEKNG